MDPEGSVRFVGAALAKAVIGADTAILEMAEDGELDFEPLVSYYAYNDEREDNCLSYIEHVVYVGDALHISFQRDMGRSSVSVPLDGSYAEELDDGIKAPDAISAYKDGKILFIYEEYLADRVDYDFCAYDPQIGKTQAVCSMTPSGASAFSGLVYCKADDCLYGVYEGCVQKIDLSSGACAEANDLPPALYPESALMYGDNYYVMTSDSDIAVRNVNPALHARRRVNIFGGASMDGEGRIFQQFANSHSDVSVVLGSDHTIYDKLVEMMLNQSREFDIIAIRTTDSAFASISKRGYMADLSGSEIISEQFSLLYPDLQQAFGRGEKPVCVPVMAISPGIGVNSHLLEKIGLRAEDLPTSWPDFLDGLDEMQAKCEENGASLFDCNFLQSEIKKQLFDRILEDYFAHMRSDGTQTGLDTSSLRAVLEQLESIDFGKYGLLERYGGDTNMQAYTDGPYLVNTYIDRDIANFSGDCTPLLLRMDAEAEPCLSLNCSVLFINPYSENQDIALEFIETALSYMGSAARGSLFDIDIEPQRANIFDETIRYFDENIARLQEALTQADESEIQDLHSQIADMEHANASAETLNWVASPNAITWHKANAQYIAVNDGAIRNALEGVDTAAAGISDLARLYCAGQISAAQLVDTLDSRLEMMLLEEN